MDVKFTKFQENVRAAIMSGASVLWVPIVGDEPLAEAAVRFVVTGEYWGQDGKIKQHEDYNGMVMWMDPDKPDIRREGVWSTWSSTTLASWADPDVNNDGYVALSRVTPYMVEGAPGAPAGAICLRDVGEYLNIDASYKLRRLLITQVTHNKLNVPRNMRVIVLITPERNPHPSLLDYVSVIPFELPDYNDMSSLIGHVQQCAIETNPNSASAVSCSDEMRGTIAQGLLGLSQARATRALRLALVKHKRMDDGLLPCLRDEKATAISQVDGLSLISNEDIPDMEDIGGFNAYLRALKARKLTYTPHARKLGIPRPRGYALVGPPGTAKTVAAMATAKYLGTDLVTLDPSKLFHSLLGSTESRVSAALATVTAMRSCVLLIDEIDKVLQAAHTSGATDGGVSSRVLSSLLTWMAMRNMTSSDDMIFIIITMNRVAGMPPELLRTGRIDAVWSTGLPTPAERVEILNIHMRKYKGEPFRRNSAAGDKFIKASHGFTGADVAEAVNSAVMAQYELNLEGGVDTENVTLAPSMPRIVEACGDITSLTQVMPDELAKMSQWAAKHARPVNGRRTNAKSDGNASQTLELGGSA